MFASETSTIADSHLKHVRGRENLKTFSQAHTVGSGQTMTNYFCSTCGTLMYLPAPPSRVKTFCA